MGFRRGVYCKEVPKSVINRKQRKEERDHIEMMMRMKMRMRIMVEIREERLPLLRKLLLLKLFVLLNLLK